MCICNISRSHPSAKEWTTSNEHNCTFAVLNVWWTNSIDNISIKHRGCTSYKHRGYTSYKHPGCTSYKHPGYTSYNGSFFRTMPLNNTFNCNWKINCNAFWFVEICNIVSILCNQIYLTRVVLLVGSGWWYISYHQCLKSISTSIYAFYVEICLRLQTSCWCTMLTLLLSKYFIWKLYSELNFCYSNRKLLIFSFKLNALECIRD